MNQELPDVKARFRKGRGTRDQVASIHQITEKEREFQTNICFTDYLKALGCVDHNKLWNSFNEMGIPDHITCLMRKLYVGQETTVRTRHGTKDLFKIGKEDIKVVYCHPAYITYMQSTSSEMPGWMNHKLESRLPREISTTSDMQMIPL